MKHAACTTPHGLADGKLAVGRQRGISAIECAIALPLLLSVLWALIAFGNLLHAQMILARAAQDGARAVDFLVRPDAAAPLDDLAAPCPGPGGSSLQCEVLASLANSSLVAGATAAARFETLRAAVSIEVSASVCAADGQGLGVQLQLPVRSIGMLAAVWFPLAWLPSRLEACAVAAL